MSYEITDELIERINPNPPCKNCEEGSIQEVERPHNDGGTVTHCLCTECWMTEDGEWFLPPRRKDVDKTRPRRGKYPMSADHDRPTYHKSGNKIMNGAHQAYEDVEEDYGTDDGTVSYDRFVSA